MEKTVSALDFAAVHIFQPSLLLGERSEHRAGEAVAQKLAPLLSRITRGPLRRYQPVAADRSEEHTSELQSLMRISYAVFCLKKNTAIIRPRTRSTSITTSLLPISLRFPYYAYAVTMYQ